MDLEKIRPEYQEKFRSCRFHREERNGKARRVYCYALKEKCCLETGKCAFWKPTEKAVKKCRTR